MSTPLDFVGLNTLIAKNEDLKAENKLTNFKKPRLEGIAKVINTGGNDGYTSGNVVYTDELGLTFNGLLPIPVFSKSKTELEANHGVIKTPQLNTSAKNLTIQIDLDYSEWVQLDSWSTEIQMKNNGFEDAYYR